MSRAGLQAALRAMAVVAMTMGASGVVRGTREVVNGGRVSANVDSEYRFYAAWYHVFGVLLWRAARRPEAETTLARACGAGLFIAACGRALSLRTHGHPHWSQRVLMAIEFVLPAVVLPWQARVSRTVAAGRRTG